MNPERLGWGARLWRGMIVRSTLSGTYVTGITTCPAYPDTAGILLVAMTSKSFSMLIYIIGILEPDPIGAHLVF